MREEWKPIHNYENLYLISTLGNVKSLGNKLGKKDKILKPFLLSYKYYAIELRHKNIRKCKTIHRLVAETFLTNSHPKVKTQVNHIDGNKLNNNLNNLEWCTPQENTTHYYRNFKKFVRSYKNENVLLKGEIERLTMLLNEKNQ